jgi:hypothetical protein
MLLRWRFATAPRLRLGRSAAWAGDEVSLKIECVVDGGLDIEEALGRPSRLEPLHFALASSHHLVRVLGPIVLAKSLLMRAGQAQMPESRSVGAELVGRYQFRREALFLKAHQLDCRSLALST